MAERLQIDPELMLDKAISITRQGEMLKKQQSTITIQEQQQEAVSIENVDTKKRGGLIQFQGHLDKGI